MRGPSFSLLLSPQARFVAGTFSSAERRRRPGGAEAHSFRRDSYVRADANRADDQLQHIVALACKNPEGARLSRKPPGTYPVRTSAAETTTLRLILRLHCVAAVVGRAVPL